MIVAIDTKLFNVLQGNKTVALQIIPFTKKNHL